MKHQIFFSFLLLSAWSSKAEVTVNISDSTGNPNSVQINPGESFVLRLELTTTTESSVSISYLLSTFGLGSGQFSITNRDISTSPFDDTYFSLSQVTTSNDAVTPVGNDNQLNLSNDRDLGATINNPAIPLLPGTYFVSNITLLANDFIGTGTYQISVSGGSIGDDSFNDIGLTSNTYSVVVVPEPSSYAMMALGVAVIGGFCRRRKGVQS